MSKNDGRNQRPENADHKPKTSRQDDENKHESKRYKQPQF